jgi:hypothetical protein
MLGKVQNLSIAQEDGASPATLSAGSALDESSVSAPGAGFKGAARVGATSRQRRLL